MAIIYCPAQDPGSIILSNKSGEVLNYIAAKVVYIPLIFYHSLCLCKRIDVS